MGRPTGVVPIPSRIRDEVGTPVILDGRSSRFELPLTLPQSAVLDHYTTTAIFPLVPLEGIEPPYTP